MTQAIVGIPADSTAKRELKDTTPKMDMGVLLEIQDQKTGAPGRQTKLPAGGDYALPALLMPAKCYSFAAQTD
jgi:hypothetical protein